MLEEGREVEDMYGPGRLCLCKLRGAGLWFAADCSSEDMATEGDDTVELRDGAGSLVADDTPDSRDDLELRTTELDRALGNCDQSKNLEAEDDTEDRVAVTPLLRLTMVADR